MPRQRRRPFVVIANRLPVRWTEAGGRGRWVQSPGGLVSALRPITEKQHGAWVGWTGRSGTAPAPFTHHDMLHVPVALSRAEMDGYYRGFCNSTLWPLYHDAVRNAEYRRDWWRSYVAVNERYAEIAADLCAPGALVWVQDYHLQLVPSFLRARRPDVRIGFFLHIPFPPIELFVRLPWRREIVAGLLGADVIGFQTDTAARNFIGLVREYSHGTPGADAVEIGGRHVAVRAFPISIDAAKYDAVARLPAVARRAQELHDQVGRDRKIILGVDRLDYTKGIENRLQAFWDVLASRRWTIRDCVMVQVAVPSRERVQEYRVLRRQVEELVGQINGRFGEVGRSAVHYLRRNLPLEELVAMYRSADVMLVTPLVDGMNLVAKEYVMTQVDESGVLILSEFAGAAHELTSALLVNPHDVDGLAASIERALAMPRSEAIDRMRAMRETVQENTVFDWADRFLAALERAS